MSVSIVRGSQPQNDKKAQYYRMGSLQPFALVFWEVKLDVYRYIFAEGIVLALLSSVGRSLSVKKSKSATKLFIAGEPWHACLSSLFPLH
jgi:hypothetical protein